MTFCDRASRIPVDYFLRLVSAPLIIIPPSRAHFISVDFPAPNKRPTSSITPTILETSSGSFLLALGAAGSTRIYTATLQTILNALDYSSEFKNVSAAIESSRAHHQLYPNVADLDSGYAQDLVDGLIQRGHNVTVHDINEITSSVQAIQQSADGTIWGK